MTTTTTATPSSVSLFRVGNPVCVDRGNDSVSLDGVVAYVGPIEFASGNRWVGVRLTGNSIGKGKNDGAVQGKRYFSAPNNCGIFVKDYHLTMRTNKTTRHPERSQPTLTSTSSTSSSSSVTTASSSYRVSKPSPTSRSKQLPQSSSPARSSSSSSCSSSTHFKTKLFTVEETAAIPAVITSLKTNNNDPPIITKEKKNNKETNQSIDQFAAPTTPSTVKITFDTDDDDNDELLYTITSPSSPQSTPPNNNNNNNSSKTAKDPSEDKYEIAVHQHHPSKHASTKSAPASFQSRLEQVRNRRLSRSKPDTTTTTIPISKSTRASTTIMSCVAQDLLLHRKLDESYHRIASLEDLLSDQRHRLGESQHQCRILQARNRALEQELQDCGRVRIAEQNRKLEARLRTANREMKELQEFLKRDQKTLMLLQQQQEEQTRQHEALQTEKLEKQKQQQRLQHLHDRYQTEWVDSDERHQRLQRDTDLLETELLQSHQEHQELQELQRDSRRLFHRIENITDTEASINNARNPTPVPNNRQQRLEDDQWEGLERARQWREEKLALQHKIDGLLHDKNRLSRQNESLQDQIERLQMERQFEW